MRRIVMFNRVSADGYFADANGGLGWVMPEPELDREAASGLSGTGTILFGRRTYEMFESFWPHAIRDDGSTAADPHAPGRISPEMRSFAEWINAATKIVWSRTRSEVTWHNSHLLKEFDPAAVEELMRGEGGDMMIFGSGSIVAQLTAHGLIDEYQLIVGPVLLGAGRPWLADAPAAAARLELVESTPFPSGNVRLRYVPNR
jgi:dihydrofolate reductase